jgi:hypothetical protein
MENKQSPLPLKTDAVEVLPKKHFLPEYYSESQEPFFEGRGNHSVSKLEEICEGYKDYAHKADIAFYAASRGYCFALKEAAQLKEENERLREALTFIHNQIQGAKLKNANHVITAYEQKLIDSALNPQKA